MFSILLAAAIQAAAAPSSVDCAQPQTAAIDTGGAALNKRDYPAAIAAVAPLVAACNPRTRPGIIGRLITAEAAAGKGDWTAVIDAVKDLNVEALPTRFQARVAFLRLGAYAAWKDEAQFAATRTRLMTAEKQALAKLSPPVEQFDVGAYHVTAYKAPVTQGSFVRLMEFTIEPTAPFAYPQSVMLTDDKGTAGLSAALGLQQPGAAAMKIYFVDMYNCAMHMTLKQVQAKDGAAPDYAVVKALVVSALSDKPKYESGMTAGGACLTSQWITPGLAH